MTLEDRLGPRIVRIRGLGFQLHYNIPYDDLGYQGID